MARLVIFVAVFSIACGVHDVLSTSDGKDVRALSADAGLQHSDGKATKRCEFSNNKAGVKPLVIEAGRSCGIHCNVFNKAVFIEKAIKAELTSNDICSCKTGPYFGITLTSFLSDQNKKNVVKFMPCSSVQCLKMHTEFTEVAEKAAALPAAAFSARWVRSAQREHEVRFDEMQNWEFQGCTDEPSSIANLQPSAQATSSDEVPDQEVQAEKQEKLKAITVMMGLLTNPDPKVQAEVQEKEQQQIVLIREAVEEVTSGEAIVHDEAVAIVLKEAASPAVKLEEDVDDRTSAVMKDPTPAIEVHDPTPALEVEEEADMAIKKIEEEMRTKIEDEARQTEKEVRKAKMLEGLRDSLALGESTGLHLLADLRTMASMFTASVDKFARSKRDPTVHETTELAAEMDDMYRRLTEVLAQVQMNGAHLQAAKLIDDADRSETWTQAVEMLKSDWEFQVLLADELDKLQMNTATAKNDIISAKVEVVDEGQNVMYHINMACARNDVTKSKVNYLAQHFDDNKKGFEEIKKKIDEELGVVA